MRNTKWLLAVCVAALTTAACVESNDHPRTSYRGGDSNYWNSAHRDYDRDGVPNRYDRDANGDHVPDRYQGRYQSR